MCIARGRDCDCCVSSLLRCVPFCGEQAARSEYVEKCNRKLVDKMMMIMQVSGGEMLFDDEFADRSCVLLVSYVSVGMGGVGFADRYRRVIMTVMHVRSGNIDYGDHHRAERHLWVVVPIKGCAV